VIGAAGMIGRKLVARLVRDGQLGGTEIGHLGLVDLQEPDSPPDWGATSECWRPTWLLGARRQSSPPT
jgi:hypothetical protein